MVLFKIKAIQQQKITITNIQYKLNKIKKQHYCKAFSLTINSVHRQTVNKYYRPLIKEPTKNLFEKQFADNYPYYRDEDHYEQMQVQEQDKKIKIQLKKQPMQIEKKYKIQDISEKRQNKQPMKSEKKFKIQEVAEKRQNKQPKLLNSNHYFRDHYQSINQEKNNLKVQKKTISSQSMQFFRKNQHQQNKKNTTSVQIKEQIKKKKKLSVQSKPIVKAKTEDDIQKGDARLSSEQSEDPADLQQKLNEGKKQLGFPCVRGRDFMHRMKIQQQKKDVKYRLANYLIQGKSRFTPDVQEELNLLYKEDVNNNLHLMVRRGLKLFKQYAKKNAKQTNLFANSDDYKVILDLIRLMASVRCDTMQEFKQFRRILLIFYLNYANLNNKHTLTPEDMKNSYVLFRNIYKLIESQRMQKAKKKQKL